MLLLAVVALCLSSVHATGTCSDLTTEAECWPAQRDRGCWWENGRCEYVVPADYDLQTSYTCTSQDSPICAGYVQACYEVACGECAACGAGNNGTSAGTAYPPPSPPCNSRKCRPVPVMVFVQIPLAMLVCIPLCIWKIRMKKRAAERAANNAVHHQTATDLEANQPQSSASGMAMTQPPVAHAVVLPIAQAQATMPVAVAQAQPKGDPVARLEALKSMLDRGMVTQQEFDAKKAEILAEM